MTELAIVYLDPKALKLNPRNARLHSEPQIIEIARSIKRHGFVNPALIDEDAMLIAGEGRTKAALRLGLDRVPTIMLTGLDDKQKAALALADNRIAENSSWDEEMLRDELTMLKDGGEDLSGLGFNKRELDALFADDKPVEVREVETNDVDDRFWIAIRGPLKDQAAALAGLREAMKPFPDVEVELGTIAIDTI